MREPGRSWRAESGEGSEEGAEEALESHMEPEPASVAKSEEKIRLCPA